MTRLFKTFLIWLLALVLPVQAIASVAKSSCGTRHHAMFELAAAHGTQERQDSTAPAHHSFDYSASGTHGEPASAGAKDGCHAASHATFKSSFCSACAACCVGAAVLPAMPDWSPACSNSFIAAAVPLPAFTAHIPSGIERPPRLISL